MDLIAGAHDEITNIHPFMLVLLGRNGDGKSSLLNRLLSITCVLEDDYRFTKDKVSSRSRRGSGMNSLDRTLSSLEAVEYLQTTSKQASQHSKTILIHF